jgi:hypothetical protein
MLKFTVDGSAVIVDYACESDAIEYLERVHPGAAIAVVLGPNGLPLQCGADGEPIKRSIGYGTALGARYDRRDSGE